MVNPLELAHLKLILFEKCDHLRVIFKISPFDIADVIEIGIQLARSRYGRIQVAQCACAGVARVLERFFGSFVICLQIREVHDGFSLHFHPPLERNGERNRTDRQRLLINFLACHAVAAGRRANKPAALVSQINSQAVEFVFQRIFCRRPGDFLIALLPGTDLLDGFRLIQAVKRRKMRVLLKAFEHRAADSFGRGIGQDDSLLLLHQKQAVV